ncbi:hypothetical protein [Zhouia amylolytica]|uniref:hypothetical protein n=1 Tax=Zhouia amylolytica TaxID=376730 RepID=UPI0020CE419C|nr:hypothetical protein [Zhouia amylolytica]MCQ0112474.1 hypothetical protein [Zhouia amylolytica]
MGTVDNLIISIDSNDKVNSYILSYTPQGKGFVCHSNHDAYSFNGSLNITPVEIDLNEILAQRTAVIQIVILLCDWENGQHGAWHLATANCTPGFIQSVTVNVYYEVNQFNQLTMGDYVTLDGEIVSGTGSSGSPGGSTPILMLDDDENVYVQCEVIIDSFQNLGILGIEENWLRNNLWYAQKLFDFLNPELFSPKAKEFAIQAMRDQMSGYSINLFEGFLNHLLEENPFKIIEIDCNQIQKWQALAQHIAPQSIQNKIDNLPSSFFNNFEIQSLEDANGTIVNLDYFGVNISNLPNDPNTGQQFNPDGFLDYIRRHFNNFIEGSTFEPYCEISSMCETETNLWNSSNPLSSIIYIDIPMDDGVVICSKYANSYWYFMTLNAPYAGNHPVSGTRQFGYEQNSNGSYNFFVRGVDRFESNIAENLAYVIGNGNPFFGADNLWSSFQQKINQFVNNNSGSSNIIPAITNRPDWNKIEQVLNGEKSTSEIGCD